METRTSEKDYTAFSTRTNSKGYTSSTTRTRLLDSTER